MDWLPYRTAAVLFILMVSLDFSIGSFHVEVKEWNEKGMERWKSHRRQKREWIKFAAACREGEDNSKRNPIARIRSDCEKTQPIIYKISGVGIDQHPVGVFVINQKTGEINITKIVDREETPMFVIHCHAINVMTGKSVETPLDLRVRVLDINDNPPIFTQHMFSGSIIESSMENTFVMKITATDADEPNNLNSKIAYKIESQTPSGPLLFILNTENGELHIAKALDREEQSQYTLVVKASDRNGGPDGISSECLCQVKVQDVNDNFPTLSQSSFSVSILENSLSQELLRIQVFDADQEFTDNWFAEFFFISGNENHNFEITIDRTTNEGILSVVKEIDYEQFSTININIGVRNVAPFHSSVASLYQPTGIPIVVQITNVIEGPAFSPSTMTITASESLTSESILTYTVATFQAIDQDTGKIATNIRYEIGRDPAAWFQINPQTAVITFKKTIDRESIYVVNGVYTAEVLAITRGSPYTTATGTIMLTIQDVNDNCPILTEEIRRVCMDNPNVVITANDPDDSPYGPPFTFSIIAQPQDSWWDIKTVNGTSAALFTNNIEFIIYEVQVRVTDNSGKSCQRPLVIPLQACHCDQNGMCVKMATKRVKVIIIGGGGAGGGAGGGGAGGGGAGGGGAGGGGAGGGGMGGGGAGGGGAGGGGMDGWGTGGGATGGGGTGSGGAGGGGAGGWGTGGGGTDGGGGGGGTGGTGGEYVHDGTSGHVIDVGGARQNSGDTSLSAAAIGLMILGGLIFVLVPILMSQSDCFGYLGSRSAGGVGAGFEPVPECTEGAIHSWGIEGAQPEDRDVSNICAPVTGASKGEFADSSDIYTTKYGDGGMVSSGIEETTGLGATKGYGTGLGYGTTTGYGLTGRKDTFGGIKEYRESSVNMAFLDSYFSEKAFAYADEDEGRPANDCLLIYDHEGIGSPVGSIGCCSFIGDDLDESYLDTLGPKFKTLAEICLGREIEHFPGLNMPLPNPDIEVNLPPPGTTIVVNTSSSMPQPTAVGGTTVVTENTYTTTSNVQPQRPMPDPMLHGNVVVTETYTSGSTMKPPTLNVDPLSESNVVVRERVLAPAPVTDLHGMIDIPDLPGGSNVVVTERVIAPNSRLPASLSIPNLTEGSNVIVTERVIRPAASVHGNMTLPSDISSARNVVVTERVLSGTGASGGPGNLSSGPNSLLTSDNLLSQTIGTASPGSTRRRVTKYSTIQYSN
ncbi:desmoglein-1-like isoform X1 [Ahaetulla prasina]|uniref:desmoglein-1-like isoform X1 n=2 Tax=Ahaetulla prasina TaxID=499056 RepID=UPI0026489986|nr:desmoglein-1-like isoform X1 [Ahaetulla prasina]